MDCRGCDPERTLRSRIGGSDHTVDVNVTGLAGFLLAKTAAAHSRRSRRIGTTSRFVLLHNGVVGFPKLPGLWRVSVITWTLVPSWPIAIPQNSISSGGVRNSDTVFKRARAARLEREPHEAD